MNEKYVDKKSLVPDIQVPQEMNYWDVQFYVEYWLPIPVIQVPIPYWFVSWLGVYGVGNQKYFI